MADGVKGRGDPTCAWCFYFDDKGDGTGQCRVRPPKVFLVDGQPQAHFPPVEEADWCGEWKDGRTRRRRTT